MKHIQQALSDLLNLFFHDPEQPNACWSWPAILGTLGVLAAMGWLMKG